MDGARPLGHPDVMAGIAPGTTVLERYVVVKHLLGTRITDLYRARNTSNDEEVVLKALRQGVPDVVAQRFEREARMMSVIMHPNVVRLQTYGTVEGRPCLIMESVDGERLDRVIAREGAIPWPDAVKWMLGLLSGLEAVHAAQVVHRDVAPNNIVITKDGKTKLTNLDLATMSGGATSVTTGGELLGIPHYIAPERALQAKPANELSDIYSAGATLYHMVSGRVPFLAANFRELTQAFANPPSPPDAPPGLPVVPQAVQDAIAGAIDAEPTRRTRSARQFASKLRVALREEGAAARKSSVRRTTGSSPAGQRGGRTPGQPRISTRVHAVSSARATSAPRTMSGAHATSSTGNPPAGNPPLARSAAIPPSASPVARARRPDSRSPSGPNPANNRAPAGTSQPRASVPRSDVPRSDPLRANAPRSDALRTSDHRVSSRRSLNPPQVTAAPSYEARHNAPPLNDDLGLDLAVAPAGDHELMNDSSYAVDPLMGYGAYGEGPPADATVIPGAGPVLAPNVPGGSPRMGDVSMELELAPSAGQVPASADWAAGSLELDVDDDELRQAGITFDANGVATHSSEPVLGGATASDSIPSSYAFTSAAAELEPIASAPTEVEVSGRTPAQNASPTGPNAAPNVRQHSARPHPQSSAPVLGLRSSRTTGPQRKMDSKPLTLPPGVHEAGQRAQATAAGSSPYARPRRDTPGPAFAAEVGPSGTQPHARAAEIRASATSLPPAAPQVSRRITGSGPVAPLGGSRVTGSNPVVPMRDARVTGSNTVVPMGGSRVTGSNPVVPMGVAPRGRVTGSNPVVPMGVAPGRGRVTGSHSAVPMGHGNVGAPPRPPPADDDLPIDYSGPDPSATPDPRRNKRFSTGSSTLRQAAVLGAQLDMPEDVELPPLRRVYAVLACRAVDPAPPATKVGVWLESQLRGRGGVRVLSSEVFFIVLNADNNEHGERLTTVILGALTKAFGQDVQVAWQLAEEPALEDSLRPSAAVPPVVEDLLAKLH